MKNVKRVKIDLMADDNCVTVIDDDGEHVLDVDDGIESIVISGNHIEVNHKTDDNDESLNRVEINSLSGVLTAFTLLGVFLGAGWYFGVEICKRIFG